jgi:hypothetical protein
MELQRVATMARQVGLSLQEISDYVVSWEEARADFEAEQLGD